MSGPVRLVTAAHAPDLGCGECFFLELDGTCLELARRPAGLRFCGVVEFRRVGPAPDKTCSRCSRGLFVLPEAAP